MNLSPKLKAAIKRYYDNRGRQRRTGITWDKMADLKNICASRPKNCTRVEACAGTFWLTWKRPRIVTIHDENNYWTCKVYARKVKGEWVNTKRCEVKRAAAEMEVVSKAFGEDHDA